MRRGVFFEVMICPTTTKKKFWRLFFSLLLKNVGGEMWAPTLQPKENKKAHLSRLLLARKTGSRVGEWYRGVRNGARCCLFLRGPRLFFNSLKAESCSGGRSVVVLWILKDSRFFESVFHTFQTHEFKNGEKENLWQREKEREGDERIRRKERGSALEGEIVVSSLERFGGAS